jgi:hypothetical protein
MPDQSVRLRHQALTVALAAACLCGGGCARLLGHILAPQEAAMSAAGNIADTVTAPGRSELVGVTNEVDRLLNGKVANQVELKRIKEELDRRMRDSSSRGDAAQDEPERLRPWHPRVAEEANLFGRKQSSDGLCTGRRSVERGMAKPGPLPDGIPAAELPAPLDLTRIRLGPPRR